MGFLLTAFFALFAVVDPIGNLAFYVSLTDSLPREVRVRIIRKTVLIASATLLVFTFLGNIIFSLFGITIPAFKIAGGLLLLRIAFSMLQGEKPKTKQTKTEAEAALQSILQGRSEHDSPGVVKPDPDVESVAVVPLGIPLFAGPGGISTAVLLVASGMILFDSSFTSMLLVSVAILSVMVLSFIILFYADPVFDKMGAAGTLAFSRIFGLILAAIAVQLISTGVMDMMSQWYSDVVQAFVSMGVRL